MNTKQNYTKEQEDDIVKREKEALEMLKKLQLTPSAFVYYDNNGADGFITKVVPYLQDIRYAPRKN